MRNDGAPKGKLDVEPVRMGAAILLADRPLTGGMNGPEGRAGGWQSIDWRAAEGRVARLRQRIFTASQAGDLKRVRNLQKLMLRSRANALVSVRRVTERNAGRRTPGVDGEVVLAAQGKAELAAWLLDRRAERIARPVRRVFIPKARGQRRPLGIPVVADRALQALVLGALEPEWEARFEPKSYGFRPGRGCHDAMGAIYCTLNGGNPARRWILDADLTAAFDRIDHDHLLSALGQFPARDLVAGWLRAGVVDRGRFAPTEQGTPQGGVLSPLLFNIALHGMEQAAGVRYYRSGRDAGSAVTGSPVLVRYADDFVVMCTSREQAETVRCRLGGWLAPRGLAFSADKTRIVAAEDGFDFLGFSVRRYHGKLLIKPSTAALRRIRERLRAEMRSLRGANSGAVLQAINPIVRGWSAYYRTVVASEVFTALDNYMWTLAYKWAKHSHPNKPKSWVVDRYFGRFNHTRRDRWVFGDRDSGAYLLKFSWTRIVRHQLVKGRASPDDPALAGYWAGRARKAPTLPLGKTTLRLIQNQRGRCPACGEPLLPAEQPQSPSEWEQWLRTVRTTITRSPVASPGGGTSDSPGLRLTHRRCRRRHHAGDTATPALLPADEPAGLA